MAVMALIVGGEFFVEPGFELIETPGEIFVRGEQFAQLHEGAHDVDAHGDGARGVQDVGGLDSAVLSEGPGELAAAAAPWF